MIKLKANNNEDLKVIASLVQDAILPIGDFAHFKADKKLMFAINRYCWENDAERQRTNSVLTILNVEILQTKNINITDRKQSLYILDICIEGDYVLISFSDNKKIKAKVSDISISLIDTGETWEVDNTPKH